MSILRSEINIVKSAASWVIAGDLAYSNLTRYPLIYLEALYAIRSATLLAEGW